MERTEDRECQGYSSEPSSTYCTGPYVVDGFAAGGNHRGAVYSTTVKTTT
eukprot:CAMPEP_0195152130 /NCGR_PEP_ID=MMETSP0448-20130528/181831_1 /TAXON_ID=66468 /ORGANISM="Heterocapsa triquestra, Strain CCMP 448" /LENGTH=49 /DNA_ID= /DNA_START= /DNA_END= /DNA_ORIENTATION=